MKPQHIEKLRFGKNRLYQTHRQKSALSKTNVHSSASPDTTGLRLFPFFRLHANGTNVSDYPHHVRIWQDPKLSHWPGERQTLHLQQKHNRTGENSGIRKGLNAKWTIRNEYAWRTWAVADSDVPPSFVQGAEASSAIAMQNSRIAAAVVRYQLRIGLDGVLLRLENSARTRGRIIRSRPCHTISRCSILSVELLMHFAR